jgi:ribonuclease HI
MARSKISKFYTVWVGRVPGVYSSWEECEAQINGFENAVYKSFGSIEDAVDAFNNNSAAYIGTKQINPIVSSELKNLVGAPLENTICVDGSWNTVTNVTEYQGVLYPNRTPLFHGGPFSAGTNNIAEFLAIVHALTICSKDNSIKAIYSDSNTAITWVKNKKAATKISQTEDNVQIIGIVRRAEDWLNKNTYNVPILKWETNAWGENPADFGRK